MLDPDSPPLVQHAQTAALGAQAAAQNLGPFGSEFRPTNPDQLFVSNAHNAGVGTGTVSAFQDSAAGILSPIGISPFADQQTAPCWVEIIHDGRFLCTVSTGSGTISRYMIAPGCALTPLGSTPVGATGGRVSAPPDLPAVRRPDRSHPGRRRHCVFHGGRNTSSTFRDLAPPAGLVVRLVASFRTGRITRGVKAERRQSRPRLRTHVRPGRDGPLNTRGAVPGTPPPDRQGD